MTRRLSIISTLFVPVIVMVLLVKCCMPSDETVVNSESDIQDMEGVEKLATQGDQKALKILYDYYTLYDENDVMAAYWARVGAGYHIHFYQSMYANYFLNKYLECSPKTSKECDVMYDNAVSAAKIVEGDGSDDPTTRIAFLKQKKEKTAIK